MDSLEGRLERLAPEQRRSVEDYIDFLLSRPAGQAGASGSPPSTPQPISAPPPILTLQDTPQSGTTASSDPRQEPSSGEPDRSPERKEVEETGIREIISVEEDTPARGYLDYGKFEAPEKSSPSPADEAVQRVKKKLDGKRSRSPADTLLEWVE